MNKSFVLYTDVKEVLEALTNEQKGLLFQAIIDYECGDELSLDDAVVKMAFIPIRQMLDRNAEKWAEEKKKRSEAGKKGMQSRWGDKSVTKTVTKDNNVTSVITADNNVKTKKKKETPPKKIYGVNENIKLTDAEYSRLCTDYGEEMANEAIDYLSRYIPEKGYKTKDHNATIRRWVIDAVNERKAKQQRKQTTTQPTDINEYLMAQAMGANYGQNRGF